MADGTLPAAAVEPDRTSSFQHAHLAFEASYEVSALAAVLLREVDAAKLDEAGKAWCGMLIRIQQLGYAISACVDEAPEANHGRELDDLKRLVFGDLSLAEQRLREAQRSATKPEVHHG
ncbi:hypothetical protein CDN99_11720 [Roseateles aquatilis]|uniref:Uncharacterized protein n=1 Tax=Roseateles aquatilis TaxID=431061 RepID=A0A246JDZ7_9BURK|nr:hypothetical protein [Roseateles aquatilis]OWQ90829.1 hypothetical protein CDN99_11720 [Roseateles aquatilis]